MTGRKARTFRRRNKAAILIAEYRDLQTAMRNLDRYMERTGLYNTQDPDETEVHIALDLIRIVKIRADEAYEAAVIMKEHARLINYEED